MKKSFLAFLSLFLFISFGYCEGNTKSISKQDWEDFQQYKQEQESNKVIVSDEEYKEYEQYLKEVKKEETQQQNDNIKNTTNNSQNNSTKKNKSNEIALKFGKDLRAYTLFIDINENNFDSDLKTNSDYFEIKLDLFHYFAKNTAIGFGGTYFTTFKNDSLEILDIDLLIKQRFCINSDTETYFYLIGGLGYGYMLGKTKEQYNSSYYIESKSSVNLRFSLGIDLTPFIIELSCYYNYIDLSKNDTDNNDYKASRIDTTISIGYKFSL